MEVAIGYSLAIGCGAVGFCRLLYFVMQTVNEESELTERPILGLQAVSGNSKDSFSSMLTEPLDSRD